MLYIIVFLGVYNYCLFLLFVAIADVLGCKVCMSQDKYKTMQCLESEEIRALVTTDWHSTPLHVLPMMQVNFKVSFDAPLVRAFVFTYYIVWKRTFSPRIIQCNWSIYLGSQWQYCLLPCY